MRLAQLRHVPFGSKYMDFLTILDVYHLYISDLVLSDHVKIVPPQALNGIKIVTPDYTFDFDFVGDSFHTYTTGSMRDIHGYKIVDYCTYSGSVCRVFYEAMKLVKAYLEDNKDEVYNRPGV